MREQLNVYDKDLMKLMTTEHKVDRFYAFAGFFYFRIFEIETFRNSKTITKRKKNNRN